MGLVFKIARSDLKVKVLCFLALLFPLLFITELAGQDLPERIYYVTMSADDDCSDHLCSLQAALDTAVMDSADITIKVAMGTYTGNFVYECDSGYGYGDLVLEGGWTEDFSERIVDPSNTILDGDNQERTLKLVKYYGKSYGGIGVEGFTIRNGTTSAGSGGGLMVLTYSPGDIVINRNIIEENSTIAPSADLYRLGGGMYIYGFNPELVNGIKTTVSNNVIRGNIAGTDGHGQGGGAFVYCTDTLLFFNNIIYDNQTVNYDGNGGGLMIYSSGGQTRVVNNTITGNHSGGNGGGIGSQVVSNAYKHSHFKFYNNIIYGNSAGGAYGQDVYSGVWDTYPSAGNTTVYYHNDIRNYGNYPGTIVPDYVNCINQNPLFVDTIFHIAPSSPCINSGTNEAPFIPMNDFDVTNRIQDEVVDMGAFEHTGLVVHYRLEGNAMDASPNSIDGILNHASPAPDILEHDGGAIQFDDPVDFINVPHHAELNISGGISLALWLRPQSFTEPAYLISKGISCQHSGNYNLSLVKWSGEENNCLAFSYYDGTGADNYYIADMGLEIDKWYHAAVSFNYQTYEISVFLDGNLVTGSWVDGNVPDNSSPALTDSDLGIGALVTYADGCNGKNTGDPQSNFTGILDDVRIYNRMLTEEEIVKIARISPFGIKLSTMEFNENIEAGSVVSTLLAKDPNSTDVHQFKLVSGDGINDQHNILFLIEGTSLKTAGEINFENDPVCHILLQVKDNTDRPFTRPVVLNVIDMNDAPVLVNPVEDQYAFITEAYSFTFSENVFEDEDSWDHLSYSAVLDEDSPLPEWLDFMDETRTFSGTPEPGDEGVLHIKLIAEDDSSSTVTDDFILYVEYLYDVKTFAIEGLHMYPNPVKDVLYIKTDQELSTIKIYNILGLKVLEYNFDWKDIYKIDLPSLPEGVYLFRLETANGMVTGKFLKE